MRAKGQNRTTKTRALGRAFSVLAMASLVLPLTSATTLAAKPVVPTSQQASEYEASTETTRVKLLISLAKSGQHELAASLIKRYPLTGEFGPNRQLFIEGLILKARGNLTGAAKNYRAALADDPSLTLVRAELAQTLFLLQEDDSAKHHLNLLMAEAPNESEAQGIRSFIDAIDARRPFTFNAFVSVAPSTNVNNGSSIEKVYISDTSYIEPGEQKKSGIGFSAGLNAGYSHRLGNDFSLVLAGGANATIYTDGDYNVYGASQSAELRYLLTGGFLGAGLVTSENFKNDELGLSYYSYGPRVSLQKALSPKDRVNLSSVYEWRSYPDDKDSNGNALILDGAWTHAFDSSLTVSLNAGFDRITSGIDYNSYDAYSAGFSLYKELPFGITTDLYGEVRSAEFGDVFPIYNKVREDTRWTGNVRLTKRDFNLWGYAPGIEYTYIYNDSNIANYHFDSHAVEFRLSKDF